MTLNSIVEPYEESRGGESGCSQSDLEAVSVASGMVFRGAAGLAGSGKVALTMRPPSGMGWAVMVASCAVAMARTRSGLTPGPHRVSSERAPGEPDRRSWAIISAAMRAGQEQG